MFKLNEIRHVQSNPKKGKQKSKFMFRKKALCIASCFVAPIVMPAFAHNDTLTEEEIGADSLRASARLSVNSKRHSLGVVDTISANGVGETPSASLAESLRRVSGVSIGPAWGGDGSLVAVRGIGAEYNMVTLNGRHMPATAAFLDGKTTNAATRVFDFTNLASDAIKRIEVYKTGKANLSTGGIGATINAVTARPLENGTTSTIRVTAANDVLDNITPGLSSLFSFANNDGTFGASVAVDYQKGYTASELLASTVKEPMDFTGVSKDLFAQRANAQVTLQFAPTERVTSTLDFTTAEIDRITRSYSFTKNNTAPGHFADAQDRQNIKLNSLGLNVAFAVTDNFDLTLDAHESSVENTPLVLSAGTEYGAITSVDYFVGSNQAPNVASGQMTEIQQVKLDGSLKVYAGRFGFGIESRAMKGSFSSDSTSSIWDFASGAFIGDQKEQKSTAKENTYAAYLQFTTEGEVFGKAANLVAGLRYEKAEVESNLSQASEVQSYGIVDIPNGIVDIPNGIVDIPNGIVDIPNDPLPLVSENYNHFMPSLDFDLEVVKDVRARFSVSNTIALPGHANLRSPAFGKPVLLPLKSTNVDVSLEWFYGETSYTSFGIFNKRVSNIIGQEKIEDELLTERSANSKKARVDGAEASVQHFFGDSGFGVLANYTYVNSDVDYDNLTDPSGRQFALSVLSDSANLVGIYDNNHLQVHLAYYWFGKHLSSISPEGIPLYTVSRPQIDLSVIYDINSNLSVFAEGLNIAGETSARYGANVMGATSHDISPDPRYQLGARYTF